MEVDKSWSEGQREWESTLLAEASGEGGPRLDFGVLPVGLRPCCVCFVWWKCVWSPLPTPSHPTHGMREGDAGMAPAVLPLSGQQVGPDRRSRRLESKTPQVGALQGMAAVRHGGWVWGEYLSQLLWEEGGHVAPRASRIEPDVLAGAGVYLFAHLSDFGMKVDVMEALYRQCVPLQRDFLGTEVPLGAPMGLGTEAEPEPAPVLRHRAGRVAGCGG